MTGVFLSFKLFSEESSHKIFSLETWPGLIRMFGPQTVPRNKYPPYMNLKVSDPKIFLKLLVPLSDQLASWLPGTIYQGLLRLSSICFARCNSASDPKSVMSPERITNFIVESLLMLCTVRLRSSSALLLPICVSDMCANLNPV